MISLKRATKKEDIHDIITDHELFGRISEDGINFDDYDVDFDEGKCYLLIMADDIVIGVWLLYPANRSTLNIHCNILKRYRKHGKEAGNLIVKWFVDECPEQYFKLNAEIPILYPEVYYFTKKFGFYDEGINRCSICKDGKFIDQWRLGLTRDQAKQFIAGGA